MEKLVNLNQVYKLLDKVIEGQSLTPNERLEMLRFKHKLTDSETFEITVNRIFSAIQLKTEKDYIERKLIDRQVIEIGVGFVLVPSGEYNWTLWKLDKIFLDSLDTKTARKIAYDINVAFGIKVAKFKNK